MKPRKPIRVIYISTYIPQKCGIATFTKDVTTAINLLNPHALAEIMPIIKDNENPDFPWEVKHKILRSDLNSYLEAANYINNSCCDLILIEHEFGIFGGKCGNYLVSLLKNIHKPKILTCHTIITEPQNEWGQSFQKLIPYVDSFTVMTHDSAQKLTDLYGIRKNNITVIPHGTPDFTYNATEFYKKKKNLTGRLVLGNINLISERIGIEYSLDAVAEIAQKYPSVIYLAIGQTHPNVLDHEGEKYRNFLKQKIKALNIKKNVKFINHYLTIDELSDWLKAIDIYITPYLDPQQSSSGALAYAIGAGKACISTKYLYAQELLSKGRGILVPFRDSTAIAKSVINLYENKAKKTQIQRKAYKYGRFMTWTNVALQHLDLFAEVIKKHESKHHRAN